MTEATEQPAYFSERDDGSFVALDPARGPWSANHCHAGPVAALVARALERAVGPAKMLTRLSLDLIRPAPMAGLRVETSVTRDARTVATASASLIGADGKVCATASSLHLAPSAIGPAPSAAVETPDLSAAAPGAFPIQSAAHGLKGFGNFIEILFPPGEDGGPGPTTLWMRTPPLLAEETPSPFQRLCPLADCGNATARNGEIDAWSFVNADLSIHMHRPPEGEWLASRAISHWWDSGIGLSQAELSDARGPVATALQSLVIRPMAG
ncbi:MAG: thioesterase family protein [Pseudomonadota bacterium]